MPTSRYSCSASSPRAASLDLIVEPARKIRIGNKLYFGDDDSLVAEVIDNTTSADAPSGSFTSGPYEEFKQALFSLGKTPVPEWVKEEVSPEDAENFQTIFAANEGCRFSPAAGLHFSRELLNRMILNDIDKTFITVQWELVIFVKWTWGPVQAQDGLREDDHTEQAAEEINAPSGRSQDLCCWRDGDKGA